MKELFEIGKRGLMTSQRANAAIANNIANVNTDGYSRRRVVLSPLDMKRDGYSLGRGVMVSDIQRLRSDLLDQQIYRAANQLGGLTERAMVLQQIEGIMITGTDHDLDATIDEFFNSLSQLSNTPQDKNVRKIVISKAEAMTQKFRDLDKGLTNIRDGVEKKATNIVGRINSLLRDLGELNNAISLSEAQGKSDHNSKDIQVQKLKELSSLINVETRAGSGGALEIRIDGMLVLSGDDAATLHSQIDKKSGQFYVRLQNGKSINPGDGKLAANIDLYENTIPGMKEDLDTLAATIVQEINAVHRAGYGLNDGVQRDFFDPAGVTAADIAIHTDIKSDPANIAASSAAGEPGNNSNTLDLVALRDKAVLNNRSFSFNATQLISSAGIELSEIEVQVDAKNSEQTMLLNQQGSIAGVNLDEELTNMIKFQNAYQASARVLNTAQQMYDTLLTLV